MSIPPPPPGLNRFIFTVWYCTCYGHCKPLLNLFKHLILYFSKNQLPEGRDEKVLSELASVLFEQCMYMNVHDLFVSPAWLNFTIIDTIQYCSTFPECFFFSSCLQLLILERERIQKWLKMVKNWEKYIRGEKVKIILTDM